MTTAIVLSATGSLTLPKKLIPGRQEEFIHQIGHGKEDSAKGQYVLDCGVHSAKIGKVAALRNYEVMQLFS